MACPTTLATALHPLIRSNLAALPDLYALLSALQDLDDEPEATRRSAARSAKRSRTAEGHNLSERVRALPLDARFCQCVRTCMPCLPSH